MDTETNQKKRRRKLKKLKQRYNFTLSYDEIGMLIALHTSSGLSKSSIVGQGIRVLYEMRHGEYDS